MNRFTLSASNVVLSEEKSNRKYMTVKMRMFSTQTNLNGVAVTEAFIDKIIANKDEYVCMPLCADVKRLEKGNTKGLGHMYDKKTGLFMAEQIGGFHDIEKVEDEFGISLFGEARINKRNPAVCETIQRLYDDGTLCFSFEIEAENLTEENGVTIVDAEEGNDLMAMALVSIPAYPEATAVDLVAEAEVQPEVEKEQKVYSVNASNVSLETIGAWINEMRWDTDWRKVLGVEPGWPNALFVTDTYFVLYFTRIAKMFRFEYVIEDDQLVVTDAYETAFTRVEAMPEEPAPIAGEEQTAEVEVSETVEAEEETENIEAEVEASGCNKKEDAEEAECNPKNKEDAESETSERDDKSTCKAESDLNDQIAELQKMVEELAPYKEQIEKIEAEKAEAVKKAKQDELRTFVSTNGLNVEDVVISEAIENLNYEMLLSEVMKKEIEEPIHTTAKLFVDESDVDPYGGILDRV